MKLISKLLISSSLLAASTLTLANAPINQSAVVPAATTVKQALSLKDEQKVQLRGYVVKAIGDEKYEFKDNTGSITVDIDDDLWQGKPIAANTAVTLIGEVDIDYKPMKRVEIDVDAVQF